MDGLGKYITLYQVRIDLQNLIGAGTIYVFVKVSFTSEQTEYIN